MRPFLLEVELLNDQRTTDTHFWRPRQAAHADFSLGIVLQKTRQELSLSELELAHYLGTDLPRIKRMEWGEMPSEEMVPRIMTQFITSDHGRIYIEMLKLRLPESAFGSSVSKRDEERDA